MQVGAPRVKRSLGELQQAALDRVVRGALAPLASHILIERVEQDTIELESSPTIGLPTRYVRHIGIASLKVCRTGLISPLVTATPSKQGSRRVSSGVLQSFLQRGAEVYAIPRGSGAVAIYTWLRKEEVKVLMKDHGDSMFLKRWLQDDLAVENALAGPQQNLFDAF